jgi:hypothetical protein
LARSYLLILLSEDSATGVAGALVVLRTLFGELRLTLLFDGVLIETGVLEFQMARLVRLLLPRLRLFGILLCRLSVLLLRCILLLVEALLLCLLLRLLRLLFRRLLLRLLRLLFRRLLCQLLRLLRLVLLLFVLLPRGLLLRRNKIASFSNCQLQESPDAKATTQANEQSE